MGKHKDGSLNSDKVYQDRIKLTCITYYYCVTKYHKIWLKKIISIFSISQFLWDRNLGAFSKAVLVEVSQMRRHWDISPGCCHLKAEPEVEDLFLKSIHVAFESELFVSGDLNSFLWRLYQDSLYVFMTWILVSLSVSHPRETKAETLLFFMI